MTSDRRRTCLAGILHGALPRTCAGPARVYTWRRLFCNPEGPASGMWAFAPFQAASDIQWLIACQDMPPSWTRQGWRPRSVHWVSPECVPVASAACRGAVNCIRGRGWNLLVKPGACLTCRWEAAQAARQCSQRRDANGRWCCLDAQRVPRRSLDRRAFRPHS